MLKIKHNGSFRGKKVYFAGVCQFFDAEGRERGRG
jgi:hypothetical protein